MGSSRSRVREPINSISKVDDESIVVEKTTVEKDIHIKDLWHFGVVEHDGATGRIRYKITSQLYGSWVQLPNSYFDNWPIRNQMNYTDILFNHITFAEIHSYTIKHEIIDIPFTTNALYHRQSLYWYSQKQNKPYLIVMNDNEVYKYDIINKTVSELHHQISYKIDQINANAAIYNNQLYIVNSSTVCVLHLETDEISLLQQFDSDCLNTRVTALFFASESKLHYNLSNEKGAGVLSFNGLEIENITRAYYSIFDFFFDRMKTTTKWIYAEKLDRIYFIRAGYKGVWFIQISDKLEQYCKPKYVNVSMMRYNDDKSFNVCFVLSRFIVIIHDKTGYIEIIDIITEKVYPQNKMIACEMDVISITYDERNKKVYAFCKDESHLHVIDALDIIPLNTFRAEIIRWYFTQVETEFNITIPYDLVDLMMIFLEL